MFTLKQKPDKASLRQLRQLSFVSLFTSDIQHVSEKDNVVADALSPISVVIFPAAVDYTAIAKAQKDAELQSLKANFNCKLKEFPIFDSNPYLLCETSDKRPNATIYFARKYSSEYTILRTQASE